MLKALVFSIALTMPLSTAGAAALTTLSSHTLSDAQPAQVHSISLTASERRAAGRKKLKRLFKPHFRHFGFITADVRAATGDPDIAIFDRRAGEGPFRCSYITYQGKRALQCD